MGFAFLCLLAVYGIGALLLTVFESVYHKKRCRGCKVYITARLDGGACCEWVARQLLYEAKNGRLPIQKITFYASDQEVDLLRRLCKDEDCVAIKSKESDHALRADYRDCDRDCFCQS